MSIADLFGIDEDFEPEVNLKGMWMDGKNAQSSLEVSHGEDDIEVFEEALKDSSFYLDSLLDSVETLSEDLDSSIEWGNEWKNLLLRVVKEYDLDLEDMK